MTFRGSLSGYERNPLFLRIAGQTRMVEASYPLGLDLDEDGRAVVALDPDGDGDLDLAVLSLQSLRLLENRRPPGRHSVDVRLRATRGEAHALGAVVSLTAGGRRQVGRRDLTSGFHTQVGEAIHFGLGQADRVEALEVRWPSGQVDRYTDLPADGLIDVTEAAAAVEVRPRRPWPAETRPRGGLRFSLDLPVVDLEGHAQRLGGDGRPTLVNFWAPSCKPCAQELPALNALAARLGPRARVVALAVGPGEDEAVHAFVAQHQLGAPMTLALAGHVVVRAFFGDEGRVALPTTFVFDAAGQLQRTWHRVVDPGEAERLIDQLGAARATALDYYELAARVADGGDQARGVALVDEALRLHGEDVLFLRRAAGVLAQAGDPARAKVLLERAVKVAPKDASAWADLAKARVVTGDPAGARTAIERALALDPNGEGSLGPAAAS